MALTAAIATAVAAVCAAAALGLPAALMALALLPAIGLVAARPERRPLPPGLDVRILAWGACAGVMLVLVSGGARSPDRYGLLATIALLVVLPLSLLWPAPTVVRACVLLAAGSMVGALPSVGIVSWPVLGLGAGATVALVALNRLSAAAAAPAASPPSGRRVAREATILLVVSGLVGLLAAALIPTPPSSQNQEPREGEPSRRSERAGADYLQPLDRLDAGAAGAPDDPSGPGGSGGRGGREVLFRVDARLPQLWRTTTFDRYDGRTWTRSPGDPEQGFVRDRYVIVPEGVARGFLPGEPLVQRVTVVTRSLRLVPAAAQLASVDLPDGPGATVYPDSTVALAPPLGRGATLRVRSVLPSGAGLDAPGDTEEGIPTELRRQYLAVPPMPGRVSELADNVTASASTPYQKTRALEQWFQRETEVKRGTRALGPDADPIDQFLFVDHGGSSQQAASAMALMLRTLGVPSRVAVGYGPGERSPFGGEFVVRARDAHAWVEAWFPGAGWLAVDPAGRVSPPNESLLGKLRRLLRALVWVILVMAAAATIWLTVRIVRRWRDRRARPWVTRCYERLSRAGRRMGRPRQPHETPSEYCTALAAEVPDDRLVEVGALLTTAAFSPDEPPPDRQAWANEVVTETRHRARSRSRS